MNNAIHAIGVDLGGTWIRLEAVDRQGDPLRSYRAPAPTLPQLPSFLTKCLRDWKARPVHLIVASRGVWLAVERAAIRHSLRSLAKQVRVMSDVEAAWHAAFGDKKHAGVVVIAGTGSIAFGRDRAGRTHRAGGWGPLLGDEGSGFWIGKMWLKRAHGHRVDARILKWARQPIKAVAHIAALVPKVLRLATHDRQARQVVAEAQAHLADLVLAAIEGLHIPSPIPVSWGGSLLDNPGFRRGFVRTLRQKAPSRLRFTFQRPAGGAARTIARLFL